jgi:hypothetical protein
MYQRKYTAPLILKKKEDIPQVIYAGTKILKAMDYLNTSIFKIGKNFYLDRGYTNTRMLLDRHFTQSCVQPPMTQEC